MNSRRLVGEAFLHILAFALIGMGVVSLLGFLGVQSPTRHTVALLPDSALASLLIGSLVLSATHRARGAIALTSFLLLALCGYTLLHNALSGGSDASPSWVSGFLRMRSSLVLILTAVALGILLAAGSTLSRIAAQVLGGAVAMLAIASQLADLLPRLAVLSLGFKYTSTHIANLFSLLLGVAVIILARRPGDYRPQLDRKACAAGLFGVLLTCTAWYLLSQQASESVSRESDLLLSRLQQATETELHHHMALMQRMAERWQVLGEHPGNKLWLQETQSYLRDYPNLDLIALLDQNQRIWRQKGHGSQHEQWLDRFIQDPANRDWLAHTLTDNGAHLSDARDYPQAGLHMLIGTPLTLADGKRYALLAVLDIRAVMHKLLDQQSGGFSLQLRAGEHLLYSLQADSQPRFATQVGERQIRLHHNQHWQLLSFINRPQVFGNSGYLPALVMFFGLLLSLLLTISQHLAWLAREHGRTLSRVNDQLQQSLAQQAQAQKLNQRIMNFSHDVLCSIDSQGRFHDLSPSCKRLFGYRAVELIGRRFMDMLFPDDRPSTGAEISALRKGQTSHSFRNRCVHRDGHILHTLWTADWSEQEQTLFAVIHDITDLVENEAYAENQRDILSMISMDRPLPEVLSVLCLMVEEQQPQVLASVLLLDASGQHLITGAAPNLPASYNQAIDGAAIGPHSGSCGTAAFRRQLVIVEDIESDPLWENYRDLARPHGLRACWSFPLISHQGQVLGTFALYQRQPSSPSDEQIQSLANAAQLAALAIARAQDRRRIEESEQRFRSLFTYNPDTVFSCDLTGSLLSINAAGETLLGLPAQQIIGQPFISLLHAKDRALAREHLNATLKGEAQRYEVRLALADARLHHLDITQLPIMLDGQIVGIFGIAKDISERHSTQARLQATLVELERSNAELQSFAFVASHDLQEPLRKIQAFSERLGSRAAQLDDEGRDYLQRMHAAASRMQALILDLLDYSRVNTRGQALQAVDLEQVLSEVLQDLETALEQSAAKVEHQPLPMVLGDASQLRQVLQNLLSNALKFQPPGNVPHIRLYTETLDHERWALCIADNGIGFEEKYLDRIFTPFQRLHGREQYPGTGIGLAIVKKIIERHGGQISASSSPGHGSLFRLIFPSYRKDSP